MGDYADSVERWQNEAETYMREFGKQRDLAERLAAGLEKIASLDDDVYFDAMRAKRIARELLGLPSGNRRLVSVNHADAATDIVGKSAICPDCGNALLVDGGRE